jgi:hypothetical protein
METGESVGTEAKAATARENMTKDVGAGRKQRRRRKEVRRRRRRVRVRSLNDHGARGDPGRGVRVATKVIKTKMRQTG